MVEVASVTDDERRQLRVFVRLVYEMVHRPFVPSIMRELHASGDALDTDTPVFSFPEFDSEHFRSFMLDFRKVAIAEKEPTNLFKVKKLLSKLLPGERDDLKAMHDFITPMLKPKPTGEPDRHTLADVIKAMVNGELFHNDEDLERLVDKLKEMPRGAVLVFMAPMFRATLMVCNRLVALTLKYKLLDKNDLPTELRSLG